MDEISNEKIVKEKDKQTSFELFDSDETSAPWLILSSNNNNNDDPKLKATSSTQQMEKDEKCCSFDYYPMQKKKNLWDSTAQQHADGDDLLCSGGGGGSGDKSSDGDSTNSEKNLEANEKGSDVKSNDNNGDNDDDNNNDNNENSFENLSYISGDEQLGVIDDIILLPNNLYSEDEMSNSDDCVYAYRGVDFEPIRSSPEDENDFLEMDFEPDPSSEIEQDCRSLRQLDGSVNGMARDSDLSNRMQADLATFDVDNKPNTLCNRSDATLECKNDVDNAENGDDASTSADICAESCSNGLAAIPQTCVDISNGKEGDTEADTHNDFCLSNTSKASQSCQQASSAMVAATASASHATKKYTGTIPKTNRNYLNLRSVRPKGVSTPIGTAKMHRENYPSYMCKRWKNANSVPDALTYQTSNESSTATDLVQTIQDPAKTKSNTKRSMSFPFEGFIHSEEDSNNETQVVPTCSQIVAKLHSSQSQSHLYKQHDYEANPIIFNGSGRTASVTIFTGDCRVDAISAALVSIEKAPQVHTRCGQSN